MNGNPKTPTLNPNPTQAIVGFVREQEWRCSACSNLEAVECPNCDALGYYVVTALVFGL